MLRKAAETDVHAAGFGTKIGGPQPSDASQGFFDRLSVPRQRGTSLAFIVIALSAPSAQAVNQHVNAKQAEQPPKG